MKISKKLEQAYSLTSSSEWLLHEAIRKKRTSFIWLIVYSSLLLIGFIAWQNSHLKVLGAFEYFGLIGAGALSILIVGTILFLFLHNFGKISEHDPPKIPLTTFIVELLLSWLFTTVPIALPCGIIWILIEQITPLHTWLTAPVPGFLKYKGIRLVGCIATVIPAIYLYIRYSRLKKKISFLQEALYSLQRHKEEAFSEQRQFEKEEQKKSWEKLKAQRKAAEQRKVAQYDDGKEHKTAIYISHRLSSCRFCDDILVFDQGQVIQQGSHEELVADESGKYHALWHAQAQYYTKG